MRQGNTPSSRDPAQLVADPGAKLYLETQILYELLPSTQWVHLAAVIVVLGLLYNHVDFGTLRDWLGFVLLIMTVRVFISIRYERAVDPLERPQYWFNWFLAGTILYGIMWSGTAILLVPVERVEIAAFTGLLLCGLAAGAVAVSSVNLEVFLVYAASTMWPYAALLIATRQEMQSLIGWLVLLFFVVISVTAMRVNTFFTRLIDLQLRTRLLEHEVRHESRKRELAEKALLENTLEEELAEMIRKRSAKLRDDDGDGDTTPATTGDILALRGYLRRLAELLGSQMQSAEKFASLMLESNLSKDQRQYLSVVAKILHNAGSVLRRIDPGASVADLSAGIERRRFNLWRCLTYLTHDMPLAQKAKFVTLRRRVDRQVPQYVIGDDAKLNDILRQLIQNAVENSDGGAVTIAVDPVGEDANSVELEFRVEDQGTGMRADVVAALNSGAAAPADASSGLAAVQQLVRVLDGTLVAESRAGVGSTVSFRLRFGKDTEPQTA